MLKISTEGKYFVDSEGRQRIFSGINLCDKGNNDDGRVKKSYAVDFDEALIKELAENGFNIVRLGMIWDAVEPEPYKYDEEYLDRVEKVANLCEKYGIYFYLDMHQDLFYGEKGLAGDGAPKWACITDGAEFKPVKIVWAEGYFWGKATQRAFDAFWKNESINGVPLQTYFCDMWKHVAERFKDHPALFGFDVFNEPYPGTEGGKVFRKLIGGVAKTVIGDKRVKLSFMAKQLFGKNVIGCLEPFADYSLFRKATSGADDIIKKFDEGFYSEFLNRTATAIREVTDNGIIMMENSYYSNLGIPYSTPAVTVNGKREKNLCFAPHAYDIMVDTPEYKYASDTRVGGIFDEHRRSQERLDVPLLVGEWGGTSDGTEWLHHIDYLLNKFNGYQWSNTYWAYYNGILNDPIMSRLRRTVPIAVTGRIDNMNWDKDNKIYTLKYTQEKEYNAPTEMYLHAEPKSIECDGEFSVENNKLILATKPGKHKITVRY